MTEKEAEHIDMKRAALECRVFVEAIVISLRGLLGLAEAAPIVDKLKGVLGMVETALASARELVH